MSENKVFMCMDCNALFRAEVNGKCPACRDGRVKSYNESGAIIINALERAFQVANYTIPNDTDIKRDIMIKFADKYEFDPKPPKGFTVGYGVSPEEKDQNGNSIPTTMVYKQYRIDMPNWEYALELAQDKARLTKWIFSFSDVKSFMQY